MNYEEITPNVETEIVALQMICYRLWMYHMDDEKVAKKELDEFENNIEESYRSFLTGSPKLEDDLFGEGVVQALRRWVKMIRDKHNL